MVLVQVLPCHMLEVMHILTHILSTVAYIFLLTFAVAGSIVSLFFFIRDSVSVTHARQEYGRQLSNRLRK